MLVICMDNLNCCLIFSYVFLILNPVMTALQADREYRTDDFSRRVK